MPSRIIREGLLDSQRYWSVSIEARQLFLHLMLLADDVALVSLAPIFVRRRCFADAPSDEVVDKQIAELQGADLLRVYHHAGGRYAFIPRFQQKLRVDKPKSPLPPQQLYEDDPKAVEKFQKINGVLHQMPGGRLTSAGQAQCSGPAEVEVKGKEKEGEVKRREEEVEAKRESGATVANPLEKNNGDARQESADRTRSPFADKSVEQVAQERGYTQRPGESTEAFRQRVVMEVLDETARARR